MTNYSYSFVDNDPDDSDHEVVCDKEIQRQDKIDQDIKYELGNDENKVIRMKMINTLTQEI